MRNIEVGTLLWNEDSGGFSASTSPVVGNFVMTSRS
jgi:hypothetical protein